MGACVAFKKTDRLRLITMKAVKNTLRNTSKESIANAERIEEASQKVEKRSQTSRSWFEGVSAERVCKVMPNTVRSCAWQITRRLSRPGRMKHIESPCGRAHNGHVSEFTKMSLFRKRQKAGQWTLRKLWKARTWCQVDTGEVRRREFAGADPSGDAQRHRGKGREVTDTRQRVHHPETDEVWR